MKRTFSWLSCLSLLLLTACLATNPSPKPLRLSGASYQSTDNDQLAIAVDASGRKHITRVECRIDTGKSCRIIYQSTHVGEQDAYQVWTPVTGYTFRNPDIAVTDSGLAFVTWQNCPDDNPSTRLCSTWFLRSDNDLGAYVLDLGTHSLSSPVVVSRGEVVYAVHEVTIGTSSSALRFCKISDPGYTCYWASDHADTGVPRSQSRRCGEQLRFAATSCGSTVTEQRALPFPATITPRRTRICPPSTKHGNGQLLCLPSPLSRQITLMSITPWPPTKSPATG